MSVAFDRIPRPDWAATTTVPIAPDAPSDPLVWARAIFDVHAIPIGVKALFAVREAVVRVLRIPPADPSVFDITAVEDGEAVIDTDDRHLRFVAATRVEPGLLHVTTAVALKGLRGRAYFAPVRLLHDPVTRAMMNSAPRRLHAPA